MTRTELSSEERREVILALTIAVGHESKVIADLEADQEFRSLEISRRGPRRNSHATHGWSAKA